MRVWIERISTDNYRIYSCGLYLNKKCEWKNTREYYNSYRFAVQTLKKKYKYCTIDSKNYGDVLWEVHRFWFQKLFWQLVEFTGR